MIRLPSFHRLSQLKDQIVSHIIDHKILITVLLVILFSLTGFGVMATKVRNNLLSQFETAQKPTPDDMYVATRSGISYSALALLSPPDGGILGTSNDSSLNDIGVIDTSTPYPLPTITPEPTIATTTTNTYSTTSNSSGNPNCTTAAGVPNAWYSDVYPASPVSAVAGSTVTFYVYIRDCNKNTAEVSDTLTISLASGNSSTQVNGNNLPYSITTQNGQASFTVLSETAETATLVIQDITRSFTVTDINNHNPSVTFSNNSSGNPNCTTAAGVPNAWYSNVYPNPPISTTTGSVTLVVDIKDCNRNLAPVADTLNISVSSGDPSTQVNGGSLPQNVTTQNGEASFTVSSQVVGTVTLSIQDTTSSFTVTDPNNHNPSITFNGSSTPTPTDTPTPTPASTDTPTPTGTMMPTDTLTPTPSGATGST